MAKPRAKNTRARFTKEVSVMGWIEDPQRGVLLVRQAARKGPLEADVERKEQMR
jgi:antibiotic biosynthesis monooxygenase (ABM) superfamily enzyme